MKAKSSLLLFIIICASAAHPAAALASGAPRTIVAEESLVRVAMSLTLKLPTLPDAPSFTADGSGELKYTILGEGASISASSIPRLSFESSERIGGLEKISVTVEAMPGTKPAIAWNGYPRVSLRGLELRARAYASSLADIKESSKPIVDVVLPDLSLSLDEIEVEGERAEGYIDADAAEAQLVGKTILPEDPFPAYAEYLGGQPAIIELRVKIVNPYLKGRDS